MDEETKYVQFLRTKVIGNVLFKALSFYCYVSTNYVVESCEGCDTNKGGREYVRVAYYTFEYDDEEFEVSEFDALLRDDCPPELQMDVEAARNAHRLDDTEDMFKAVKELTGHDMTKDWYGQTSYTVNDVLGCNKIGGYGGKPISGEKDPDKDKIK